MGKVSVMNAQELIAWRREVGVTQERFAEICGVARSTVQNWEAGSSIPNAVESHCQIWGKRLRQEDPRRGPVTLVYADAPMFINPNMPRGRLAMLQQEPFLINAFALKRAQQLWNDAAFYNPFVLEENGRELWNSVELGRAVRGEDPNAPTPENWRRRSLTALADFAKKNALTNIVYDGPALPTAKEKDVRHRRILELATELDQLAEQPFAPKTYTAAEDVFGKLRGLGRMLPDDLVSDLAWAFLD
jgi:hypothetical protein